MIRYRIANNTRFAPYPEREAAMTILARAASIAVASITVGSFGLLAGPALAQPAQLGCTSAPATQGTQTLHCPTEITIVAESGAKFELRDRNRDGHVDSV